MRRTRRAGGSEARRRSSPEEEENAARNSPTGTRTDSSARSSDEEAVRGGCVPDEGQRASEPAGRAWERAKRRNVRRRTLERVSGERDGDRERRALEPYLTSRGGDVGGGESEKDVGTGLRACERERASGVRRMGDADRVEGYGRGGPEAGGRLGASQVCGARQKHGRLLRESDEDGVVRAETDETAREQDVDRDAHGSAGDGSGSGGGGDDGDAGGGGGSAVDREKERFGSRGT